MPAGSPARALSSERGMLSRARIASEISAGGKMELAQVVRGVGPAIGAALVGFVLGRIIDRRTSRRAVRRLHEALERSLTLDPAERGRLPADLARLAAAIEKSRTTMREADREAFRAEMAGRLQGASARLAHDIRSPLAALEVFLSAGRISPETHLQVLKPALSRLRGIAGLLTSERWAHEVLAVPPPDPTTFLLPCEAEPQPALLSAIIEAVISALRLRPGFLSGQIDFDEEMVPYGLFVHVPQRPLRRALEDLALSMLAEASGAGDRILRFSVGTAADVLTCRVELVGSVTGRLFSGGIADPGKPSGLAKEIATLQGILIPVGGAVSRRGSEIAIEITAPLTPPPSWFLPEIDLPLDRPVLVVDDDDWVHQMWERAFRAVPEFSLPQIVHLHSLDQLESRLREDGPLAQVGLLLVDDGYVGSERSGLDLLERFREVVPRAVLVTGRWEEPQVRSRSLGLGLRLLPKNLIARIPIVSGTGGRPITLRGRPDAVLVDDHIWIRKGWELSAARAGKRLLTCKSMQEFLAVQPHLDRSTVLFIDSDLCDEIPGEQFAWSMFDAGFTEIYLATGFDADRFTPMPWLRGIIGKDPPDWSHLHEPGDDPLARFALPREGELESAP